MRNSGARSAEFLRSLGRAGKAFHKQHLKKPYTTFRRLRDMADAFDDGQLSDLTNPFLQALAALDNNDVVIDIGAGQSLMMMQYLTQAQPAGIDQSVQFPPLSDRACAVAIDIRKPREADDWENTLDPETRRRYRYIQGYFEAVSSETVTHRGLANVCLDFYGGASYTLRMSEYLEQLSRIVRASGQLFLVLNGVSETGSRADLLTHVETRVSRLWGKIRDDRLGGVGREKVDGESAKSLFDAFIVRLDGSVVFLEDWLAELPGLTVRKFAVSGRFAIPLLLSFDGPNRIDPPALKLVEANAATPPYRLFREIERSSKATDG